MSAARCASASSPTTPATTTSNRDIPSRHSGDGSRRNTTSASSNATGVPADTSECAACIFRQLSASCVSREDIPRAPLSAATSASAKDSSRKQSTLGRRLAHARREPRRTSAR